MAATQRSGRPATRGLTAQCNKCGDEVHFCDEREGQKRLADAKCDCGGRYHRGRFIGRPSPMEVHGLLISLLGAEYKAQRALEKHGLLSDEHVLAGEILRKAKAEWWAAHRMLEAAVRLKAELEDA